MADRREEILFPASPSILRPPSQAQLEIRGHEKAPLSAASRGMGSKYLTRIGPSARRSRYKSDRSPNGLHGAGSLGPCSCVFLMKMSRPFKIALILQSRSSLPLYRDLDRMSDRELEEQVLELLRRMRRNESAVIARMIVRDPTFSLN